MLLQQITHLDKLGEDQRRVTDGNHFFHHFRQAAQLAAAPDQWPILFEKVRRMVADLLELGEQRQHHATPLNAIALVEDLQRFADHLFIKHGLFACQRTVDDHLIFLGQVGNNVRIGFQAP